MFIGRENESKILESAYHEKRSVLSVVYGRRRIGKSYLLQHFSKSHPSIYIEGLEKQPTSRQIENFMRALSHHFNDPLILRMKLKAWSEVFDFLTQKIDLNWKNKSKTLIIFDEFQWMACNQSKLVSYLKNYWDNHWKNKNVFLILCGSVAHYMVKKVIQSKALYGRINLEINLMALKPNESHRLLHKRGSLEGLNYLLIFGGIPKYLEEIDQSKSFNNNINRLCFQKDGYFISEPNKIFFSQFKEAQTYKKIVELLSKGNYSLKEISNHLKIASGGGLKSYLENLEKASFIRSYTSLHQKGHRSQKYKLFDEFLIFYYKFMKPKIKLIKEIESGKLFENSVEPHWNSWLGIAFETFCLKNALYIAEICGFKDDLIDYAPLFSLDSNKFQIDLIYKMKSDVYAVCEIKYHRSEIGTWIIPEFNKKLIQFQKKGYETVQKILIAPFGEDKSLKDAQYFDRVITLKEIFQI